MKPVMVYPGKARVRRDDVETSHLAADSNDVAASSRWVLNILEEHGALADHEIVQWLSTYWTAPAYTPQRIRTARAELVESGHVVFAGYTRLTPSGRKTRVWQLTEQDAA